MTIIGIDLGTTNSEVAIHRQGRVTVIPDTRKSEVFYTAQENQQAVEVRIHQGEHRDALKNRLIGAFRIEGLSPAPIHSPVVLAMDLDTDGLLHVAATEKRTGLSKKITISNALAKLDENALATARERVGALFGENDEEAEHRHEVVQARALVEKAERMLEQASEEDREEMIDLIEALRDALAAGDIDALTAPGSALAEILFYLET